MREYKNPSSRFSNKEDPFRKDVTEATRMGMGLLSKVLTGATKDAYPKKDSEKSTSEEEMLRDACREVFLDSCSKNENSDTNSRTNEELLRDVSQKAFQEVLKGIDGRLAEDLSGFTKFLDPSKYQECGNYGTEKSNEE